LRERLVERELTHRSARHAIGDDLTPIYDLKIPLSDQRAQSERELLLRNTRRPPRTHFGRVDEQAHCNQEADCSCDHPFTHDS
jgi:hypothetical protein